MNYRSSTDQHLQNRTKRNIREVFSTDVDQIIKAVRFYVSAWSKWKGEGCGESRDGASDVRQENERTEGINVASKHRASKRPSRGEKISRTQEHVKRGDQGPG